MATECSTCLAIARGGRVRVTAETALLLEVVLRLARRMMLRWRREAIIENNEEMVKHWNQSIRSSDRLVEEVARTMKEMGWRDGQSE